MNTEDKRPNERPVTRRRFQYSLRTLLLIATLVTIACSLFIASPGWVRALIAACFLITVPAILTIVIIYGRGTLRTFCIGALLPAAWTMLSLGRIFLRTMCYILSMHIDGLSRMGEPLTAAMAVSIVLGIVAGLIAVGTRWWIELPQRRNPPDTSPRE